MSQEFIEAVQEGRDEEAIELLVSGKARPEYYTEALKIAYARDPRSKIIPLLVKEGANIETLTGEGVHYWG